MIANLLLAGWVAVTVPWTSLPRFTLVCTGTQTAYQDSVGIKQTLPWQEAFSVDLVAGTYCSQGCANLSPLHTVTADGMDLDNSVSPDRSSLKRFHAASGAIETNTVMAASPTDSFHLEQAGVCKITS